MKNMIWNPEEPVLLEMFVLLSKYMYIEIKEHH